MTPDSELRLRRGLLLALAPAIALAILAGLGRLPGAWWFLPSQLAHGPLFVVGVFGTVIGLERAVALARPWALLAPSLGVLGAWSIVLAPAIGAWIAALACLVALVVNVAIMRRQRSVITALMALASLALLAGTLGWALGRAVFEVSLAWLAFFVLTIVAERLELSRLAPRPRWAEPLLVVLALTHVAAAVLSREVPHATRVVGVTFLAIAGWQLRFDLARRTLRREGLPQFVAAGVLLGTPWLAVTGALLLPGALRPGLRYDAALHATLVGFVLSMVMAHALVILPAVARVELAFTRWLFAPLVLLHLGVAVRVAGDLAAILELRVAGSIVHSLALVLFAGIVLHARLRVVPERPAVV